MGPAGRGSGFQGCGRDTIKAVDGSLVVLGESDCAMYLKNFFSDLEYPLTPVVQLEKLS